MHNLAVPSIDPDGGSEFLALLLIFITITGPLIGGMVTLMSLRNARLWLLRVCGRKASGVVSRVEIVTSPNGEVLRRPVVAFRTEDGSEVAGTPVLFRTSTHLSKGSPVEVSYSRRRPTRLVVHGYDFRRREVVYASIGLVIMISTGSVYFVGYPFV